MNEATCMAIFNHRDLVIKHSSITPADQHNRRQDAVEFVKKGYLKSGIVDEEEMKILLEEDDAIGAENVLYLVSYGEDGKPNGVLRVVSGVDGRVFSALSFYHREASFPRISMEHHYRDDEKICSLCKTFKNPVELTRLYTSPDLSEAQRINITFDLFAAAFRIILPHSSSQNPAPEVVLLAVPKQIGLYEELGFRVIDDSRASLDNGRRIMMLEGNEEALNHFLIYDRTRSSKILEATGSWGRLPYSGAFLQKTMTSFWLGDMDGFIAGFERIKRFDFGSHRTRNLEFYALIAKHYNLITGEGDADAAIKAIEGDVSQSLFLSLLGPSHKINPELSEFVKLVILLQSNRIVEAKGVLKAMVERSYYGAQFIQGQPRFAAPLQSYFYSFLPRSIEEIDRLANPDFLDQDEIQTFVSSVYLNIPLGICPEVFSIILEKLGHKLQEPIRLRVEKYRDALIELHRKP